MPPAKILVVDDEIIIARELEARLKAMGFEVPEIASSGAEAIALATTIAPDLILMDIVLKGEMDGIEAAEEIRRRLGVPIIYLTAYADRKTLERARITEPSGYIVKPFSERELEANIEMALYKHRSEQRLRRVEQWFVAAINETGDAVITADQAGTVTVINPAAAALTGWHPEQAIGRPLNEVLQLVDGTTDAAISLDDVSDGPVICLASETVLLSKEGHRIPTDSTTSCIRDPFNRPVGTVTVFRDASGQRHGTRAALNADATLAITQASTLGAMLQLCAESMVHNFHASLACVWTLNATAKTLILQGEAGMHLHNRARRGVIPIEGSIVGTIAATRKPYLTNSVHDNLNIEDREWAENEGMLSFAGYPLIVDDRLVGVIGIYCRHRLPESTLEILGSVAGTIAIGVERKRLEEQLSHAQKMEVIGQLAGGIAHDFNNLLTVISGYGQVLLKSEALDEDSATLVQRIVQAGERATALTYQLLAFSRKQVLNPRTLNLADLVTGIERMLTHVIDESISVTTVLAPDLAGVTADPGQLDQVLLNLAINARDAMPEGGQLTIEAHNVELDETFALTNLTAKPGEYVMLAVSDTGHGMTPEVSAHIFEPFFTTKGPGKGTGLGLSTVYGIIRQSGGYLSVYSEPGLGSTFKIYLPRTDEHYIVPKPKPINLPLPKGTETILLVEDEDAVRALSRYILQACGYTVLEAGDGEEALRVCGDHAGEIHLIVTDVVLPSLNGRVLAERLAAKRPNVKVLYMSGYTDDAIIRHGVLQAETMFLQKPFTPSALAGKVRAVLNKQ